MQNTALAVGDILEIIWSPSDLWGESSCRLMEGNFCVRDVEMQNLLKQLSDSNCGLQNHCANLVKSLSVAQVTGSVTSTMNPRMVTLDTVDGQNPVNWLKWLRQWIQDIRGSNWCRILSIKNYGGFVRFSLKV